MTNSRLRVLSLTNAFPPGVTGRFPAVNPAGHATETRMNQALAKLTHLSTVGLLPEETFGHLEPNDGSLGLEHELLLWERKPELWHRWRSWRELRAFYSKKTAKEGAPDIVLVRNLTPVFNQFARWLRRHQPHPRIVLIFADSATLGRPASLSRRIRYTFKPMQMLDEQAIGLYEACISFGIATCHYFEARGIPWMWMPSAFNFQYDPPPALAEDGPIRFGYFGALAEHAAVLQTVQAFLDAKIPGSLHMCGFGKLSDELKRLSERHPNFHFDGLLPKQSDCLAWAQKVDVLINPRVASWGLENSFPSKIFEFGMTGKAILTTRTGGVDEVLKDDGMYLDGEKLEESLREKLRQVAAMDRADLQHRGSAIRDRLLKDFNWDEQARRMVQFLEGLLAPSKSDR